MEINPIEIMLAAFGIKSVQRPLVFISMLVSFVAFTLLGGTMLYMLVTEIPQKETIEWMPVFGDFLLTSLLFLLAWLSLHFMRKATRRSNASIELQ
ncbi:MAG: hypothetical protein AB2794_21560 [Candidatus Thiodiazotropha endolucinida]